MGGFFGVTSKSNCAYDLFFGIDYHSHLGTYRGGMTIYADGRFQRAIHNIENSPFRTKFERDVETMSGMSGIGCISDTAPQPLTMRSHLGTFAITTVGRINNLEDLIQRCFKKGLAQFSEMSNANVNPTELVAALVGSQDSIAEGIRYAQHMIEGSMSMLLLTRDGIYAARDKVGRTPVVLGRKDSAFCAASENFSFFNLGYEQCRELGPAEIVYMTPDGTQIISPPRKEMKICAFLWTYYGYPTTSYEGVNVEDMRNLGGSMLASRDNVSPDLLAAVPDSGTAYAIGYSNSSGIPLARPFIKYTPTWPRSFMPHQKQMRDLIAKMKLVPVEGLIKDKSMLLIDDSVVRGTQLKEASEFLYTLGAKEVHIRAACPPLLFGCKYLNFSRSTSGTNLIARRVIQKYHGDVTQEELREYANPDSGMYEQLVENICKELDFDTLRYHRLDDLKASIGIDPCKLCTYCWSGEE